MLSGKLKDQYVYLCT